jgi:hypothetical protein
VSYAVRGCDLAGKPPHPLLPGLRLLREFRHPNGLRIAGPFGPATHRPDPVPKSISADPDTGVVFDFVEAIAIIQDHTTAQLQVPDLAKLTHHDIRGILRLAELMRGAAISVPWEGFAVHLWPGTTPPTEGLFSTLLYQQQTITLNGIQASVGYQQVYLPAARVESGSFDPARRPPGHPHRSGGRRWGRYQVRTEPTAPARRSRWPSAMRNNGRSVHAPCWIRVMS